LIYCPSMKDLLEKYRSDACSVYSSSRIFQRPIRYLSVSVVSSFSSYL
jgi:hypothetical protein